PTGCEVRAVGGVELSATPAATSSEGKTLELTASIDVPTQDLDLERIVAYPNGSQRAGRLRVVTTCAREGSGSYELVWDGGSVVVQAQRARHVGDRMTPLQRFAVARRILRYQGQISGEVIAAVEKLVVVRVLDAVEFVRRR